MERKNYYDFLILFVFIMFFSGCATTQHDWEQAVRIDKIQSYEAFLKKHPNSEYSSKAQKNIARLKEEHAWEDAIRIDKISEYENFLKKYPQSQYAVAAKHKLENLYYKLAEESNTIGAYKAFIARFPNSKLKINAEKKIEEKTWGKALEINTISSYQSYLTQYPQGKFSKEASNLIDIISLKLTSLEGISENQLNEYLIKSLINNDILLGEISGSIFKIDTDCRENLDGKIILITGTPSPINIKSKITSIDSMKLYKYAIIPLRQIENGMGYWDRNKKVILGDKTTILMNNGKRYVFMMGHWWESSDKSSKLSNNIKKILNFNNDIEQVIDYIVHASGLVYNSFYKGFDLLKADCGCYIKYRKNGADMYLSEEEFAGSRIEQIDNLKKDGLISVDIDGNILVHKGTIPVPVNHVFLPGHGLFVDKAKPLHTKQLNKRIYKTLILVDEKSPDSDNMLKLLRY